MIKIRLHKGSLDLSMETEATIPANLKSIRHYLLSRSDLWIDKDLPNLKVESYCDRVDTRINWNKTYIVLVDNNPVAFCSDMVKE